MLCDFYLQKDKGFGRLGASVVPLLHLYQTAFRIARPPPQADRFDNHVGDIL